jgi:hypothetical protein
MIKRYTAVTDSPQIVMKENTSGEWVKFSDYEKVADYADRLVALSDLPCLPKDLENLRNANAAFAEENHRLNELVASLRKDTILATL